VLAHPDLSSAAATYGVDYELLKAVAIAESGFNAKAVSPKGAVGLMQVMPATAQRYGVQPAAGKTVSAQLTDPALNIATGARYLADLLKMFSGRLDLVLAAYNAGENAVKRAGHQIPDYRETRDYVVKVMALYDTQKARAR
jgi:soluble lytic murein transglycosylase-like protein